MNRVKTKHSGRIERAGGLKTLAHAKWVWDSAYKSACKHDDIPEDSKFVVFSDDNPFRQFVDIAASQYFDMLAQYRAGGYIGLQIG